MLNSSPEYLLKLHNAELASLLAAAEYRRNAERRRTGSSDPVRRRPAPAVLLGQVRRITSFAPLRAARTVPCEACP